MEKRMENICVGGTFDPIHTGHLRLLEEAFMKGMRVSVGLTSDSMAARSRRRRVEPYPLRIERLEVVLDAFSRRYNVPFTVFQINDRFGFAAGPEFDSIVVSEETEGTVDDIDMKRMEIGLPPLKRFVIGMVNDAEGVKISSTRVLRGEIDPAGNMILTEMTDETSRKKGKGIGMEQDGGGTTDG